MIAKAERFAKTWYGLLLLLAVPIFAVFSPLLVGGRILYWDDGVIQGAAYFAFLSQALGAGDSFLWNPNNFFGYPIFATAFGFFAPWNYLIAAAIDGRLAAVQAIAWIAFATFVLSGFFTALLLRALGVSAWAAYLGAVAFVASHQTSLLLPVINNYDLLLPLLFLIILKLEQTRSWRYVLAGGLAVAFGWLAVNFQEAFYILVIVPWFAAFLLWRRRRDGGTLRLRQFAGELLLVYLIGTSIGLVQILPSELMASISTRSGGIPYAAAVEDAVLPTDFLRFVIPDFKLPLGIPFGSGGGFTPYYMGVLPLLFFLYAMYRPPAAAARFFVWLFWSMFAVAVIYSPFFWLLTKLPVFSYFRVPDRWMFIAAFSAALLAAYGADRAFAYFRGETDHRLRRFFSWFAAAMALVIAGVAALNVMFQFFEPQAVALAKRFFSAYLYGYYQPAGVFPPAHYFGIIDKYFIVLHQYFSLRQPLILAAVGSSAAGITGFWLMLRYRRELGPRAAAVIVTMAVLNFVVVKAFDFRTMPAAVYAKEPATIEFLRRNPGRTLPFLSEGFEENVARSRYGLADPADKFLYRASMLVPNTNLFYGVESAVMKDGLEPLAISRLASLVGAPVIGIPRELPVDTETASELLVERKRLLDFLGIRYIVSGYLLDDRVFPEAFTGTVTSRNIPIHIYENPTAAPLLYLVSTVNAVSGDEAAVFEKFAANGFAGIFVGCTAGCADGQERFSADGRVEVLERRNASVKLRVVSPERGFLVFSQNNLPGWQAFVDGQATEISTVNTVFMGAVIPAGRHEITFRYANPCGGWNGFLRCIRHLLAA